MSNLVVRLATFPITILTQRKSGRMAVSAARARERCPLLNSHWHV